MVHHILELKIVLTLMDKLGLFNGFATGFTRQFLFIPAFLVLQKKTLCSDQERPTSKYVLNSLLLETLRSYQFFSYEIKKRVAQMAVSNVTSLRITQLGLTELKGSRITLNPSSRLPLNRNITWKDFMCFKNLVGNFDGNF